MLYLIGSGLWRWDDICIRGAEICRRAHSVYLDRYTRKFDPAELKKLEEHTGKKIIELDRKALEEELGFLDEAVEKDVALIVPGDPLIATTHATIIMEARRRGVEFEIVHGSSIHSSLAGEAGLQVYKLGGSCTIPFADKVAKPYSTYEKIAANMKAGLHTLVFLDTSPEREMAVREALGIMCTIENEKKEGICADEKMIVVGCRVGSKEQKICYGKIGKLKTMEFKGPCTLIFPAQLHFSEEEFLSAIAL